MPGNKSFLRMEKNAVNKKGLILVGIFTVLILGLGIALLVINKDKIDFDFSLPWVKSAKEKEQEKKEKEEQKKLQLERKKVEISSDPIYKSGQIEVIINPSDFAYNELLGYTFKINFINNSNNYAYFDIQNVTIDGYQTDISFNFSVVSGGIIEKELTIPLETLDLYQLEVFSEVNMSGTLKVKDKTNKINLKIKAVDAYESVTEIKGLDRLGSTEDFKISYYKVEDDEEKHTIYLYFENKDELNSFDVLIKSLKINGKIVDKRDFVVKVYNQSKKIATMEILKKDFRVLQDIEISFFLLNGNDVYTTATDTIKFKD